jgi:uncharacterized caspase-like protein
MKRKAIIVGNEGILGSDDSYYLGGVNTDLDNIYKFIRSDYGGAWRKDEILPFEANQIDFNSLKKIVLEERQRGEVDYWFIYFSGHGASSKSGTDYLEIKPDSLCSIPDLLNVLGNKTRALLIADACRYAELFEGKKEKSSVKYFSDLEKIDTIQRMECRDYYNDAIDNIPQGSFFIAQACSFGQYSWDAGVSKGGAYTAALMESAKKMIASQLAKNNTRERSSHIITFSTVHYDAAKTVPNHENKFQQPTYSGPKCFQPPFCAVP